RPRGASAPGDARLRRRAPAASGCAPAATRGCREPDPASGRAGEPGLDLAPPAREAARRDRRARALEQPEVEAEAVERGEPRAQDLVLLEQVTQVRARVVAAGGAVARGVDRARVARVARVADAQHARAREQHTVSAVAGGQHAVEEIDAERDRGEQVLGAA